MTKINIQCLVPEDHAWVDPEAGDSLTQINDDSLVRCFQLYWIKGLDTGSRVRGLAVIT